MTVHDSTPNDSAPHGLVEFGSTGLRVSALCVGTSSWGPARTGESVPTASQCRMPAGASGIAPFANQPSWAVALDARKTPQRR